MPSFFIGSASHFNPFQNSKFCVSILKPIVPILAFFGLPSVFHEGITKLLDTFPLFNVPMPLFSIVWLCLSNITCFLGIGGTNKGSGAGLGEADADGLMEADIDADAGDGDGDSDSDFLDGEADAGVSDGDADADSDADGLID